MLKPYNRKTPLGVASTNALIGRNVKPPVERVVCDCTSVPEMVEMAVKNALLRYLFQDKKILQSTMSLLLIIS
jgi:hypothetical protein